MLVNVLAGQIVEDSMQFLKEPLTTDNQRDVHRGWLGGRVRRLSSEEVNPGHAHSHAEEAVRLGAGNTCKAIFFIGDDAVVASHDAQPPLVRGNVEI